MEESLKQRVWDFPLTEGRDNFIKMILEVKEQCEGVKLFKGYMESLALSGKMASAQLEQFADPNRRQEG